MLIYTQLLPMPVNMALFLILALGVWWAGTRLTLAADLISGQLKISRTTFGLVFLATATSLPEIVTTFSGSLLQNADLVLNNLFGGIALQTTILAIADFWARGAITNYPRKASNALEATLLVTLLVCLHIVVLLGEPVTFYGVGLGSVVIALIYIFALVLLRRYEDENDWVPVDLPLPPDLTQFKLIPVSTAKPLTTRQVWGVTAITCSSILVLGIGLVAVSEALAIQTGLGSSFIGVTLLAGATSLPELATTITAVRMGAYTLAISNIFGSNLIMIVLVFPADMLYRVGPILKNTSQTLELAIALGILTTSIYLVGLIVRRKINFLGFGIDSIAVIALYVSSLFIFYFLR
jgi:cation:H+ antiporter